MSTIIHGPVTLTEDTHYGFGRVKRSRILPAPPTWADFLAFMAGGANAATANRPNAYVRETYDELMLTGDAEHGWASYTLTEGGE